MGPGVVTVFASPLVPHGVKGYQSLSHSPSRYEFKCEDWTYYHISKPSGHMQWLNGCTELNKAGKNKKSSWVQFVTESRVATGHSTILVTPVCFLLYQGHWQCFFCFKHGKHLMEALNRYYIYPLERRVLSSSLCLWLDLIKIGAFLANYNVWSNDYEKTEGSADFTAA